MPLPSFSPLCLQMKELSRQPGSPFHQKVVSSKPMSMFPWRRCLNWAQEKAPLVTHCIRALFPDAAAMAKSSQILTEEQAGALLDRRLVTALSMPLFTRNVYKNNFVQASLGAELRMQGVSGSGLDALNALGLCQNKDTVRLLLLRLLQGRRGRLLSSNVSLGQRLKQEELKADQTPDVEEADVVEEEGSEEAETESDTERAEVEVTGHGPVKKRFEEGKRKIGKEEWMVVKRRPCTTRLQKQDTPVDDDGDHSVTASRDLGYRFQGFHELYLSRMCSWVVVHVPVHQVCGASFSGQDREDLQMSMPDGDSLG
uniref:Uncharacterized protein n=1 Tax=Knipowitschia caucasica TaxID=637954 RepID=A0AAV2MLC9_KNICA